MPPLFPLPTFYDSTPRDDLRSAQRTTPLCQIGSDLWALLNKHGRGRNIQEQIFEVARGPRNGGFGAWSRIVIKVWLVPIVPGNAQLD